MITIIKTSQGCYLATLTDSKEELTRKECHHIKHQISAFIKPEREITLDLKGVKILDIPGYKILKELKQLTDSRKCILRFTNVEEEITKKIAGISGRKVLEQNKFLIQ